MSDSRASRFDTKQNFHDSVFKFSTLFPTDTQKIITLKDISEKCQSKLVVDTAFILLDPLPFQGPSD